ncbi:hypothetical protein BD289DRAFT_424652 [Coniella lustricola]|uniref:Uncharacterized protein n=1 Tax=Coniella lustricola TaxID=2025994 RepID=A0A2T3AID8_9PEZI|nr:hypothetical protein BD289DRAFT_424652 [Coniella lustricola]
MPPLHEKGRKEALIVRQSCQIQFTYRSSTSCLPFCVTLILALLGLCFSWRFGRLP